MTHAGTANVSVADRIVQLLDHLGIGRAHVAGAVPGDWRGLATSHTERLASLSLLCPTSLEPSALSAMASRVLVFHGDRGPAAERARAAVANLPGAMLFTLRDYAGLPFDDVARERGDEVASGILEFVRRTEHARPTPVRALAAAAGEVAGLSYRIAGAGPPVILLPLGLAPSHWEPLLPRLGEHCCTIALGGPHLGMVPVLEGRGQSPGYLRMMRNALEEAAPRPGEAILDVGCGSGAVARWVARHTNRANVITSIDVNRHLLQAAESLARQEGLHHVISFRDGDAAALPFGDDRFDISMSITVLEEGDADRMLAELVRVTRRGGGRVVTVVRAEDCPSLLLFPLRADVRAKAGLAMGTGASEAGCADASLYRRLHAAGLVDVRKLVQLAVYDDSRSVIALYYQGRILNALTAGEADEWRAAVADAQARGTFVLAVPHHCAVATKP